MRCCPGPSCAIWTTSTPMLHPISRHTFVETKFKVSFKIVLFITKGEWTDKNDNVGT